MKPVSFRTLYLEELRAVPRGRLALLGAAALLAFVLFGATVPAMGDDDGLDAFLFVTCTLLPPLFAVVAAAPLAADRASRFTESLFTTPLRRGAYFAVRVAVPLALGLLYVASLLPYLLVVAAAVGLPANVVPSLVSALLLVAASVAVGVLCGVLFADRGVAGPATAAGAAAVLGGLSLVMLPLSLGGGMDAWTRALLVRLAHLSPQVLAREAVGLPLVTHAHLQPALALAALAVLTLGLLALAGWTYLREQEVQGWRGPASGRALVAVALVALLALPAALAGDASRFAAVERESLRFGASELGVKLVAPGEPADEGGWGFLRRTQPMTFGEENARDLLVLLHVPPNATVTDLRVTVEGDGIVVSGGPFEMTRVVPEGTARYHRGLPVPGEPAEGEGVYVRFRAEVTPTRAGWVAHERYVLAVNASYVVDGEPREAGAVVLEEASVPGARLRLALAGAPALLACVAGALVRRARTS